MSVLAFLVMAATGVCAAPAAPLSAQPFGRLPDGREARLYTLRAADGFQADLCDYGARIVRLIVPDRSGQPVDVALGFADVGGYTQAYPFFGATIGRVAGRIGGAKFTLDGHVHQLTVTRAASGALQHLHGGQQGFDKVLWTAETTTHAGRPAVRFRHTSPDGDQGYPGTLHIEVLYSLTSDRGLRIDYTATTDRPTPVSLTNHVFFNLAGEGRGSILDHELTIHARHYTPLGANLVPEGVIAPVAGTPFDFTTPQRIGARIAESHDQLVFAGGYDHNFVLGAADGTLAVAAIVHEPASGRVLEVLTTEPGLQFFTGNQFSHPRPGKSGVAYRPRDGFALETQHFPDAVNQAGFPGAILRPGRIYRSTTCYRFSNR